MAEPLSSGRISCGSSTWKRTTSLPWKRKRLDGAHDGLRILVEIGDHDHDAAPMQEFLKVLQRLGKVGARARLRLLQPREQPLQLALAAWRAGCSSRTSSSKTISPAASR